MTCQLVEPFHLEEIYRSATVGATRGYALGRGDRCCLRRAEPQSDGGVMRIRVRATRLATAALVSVAVIGLAAGCSGSDEAAPATFPPAAEGRDVDTLIEALRGDDEEIPDAEYACIADSLMSSMSDQGYELLIDRSDDPAMVDDLSGDDRVAFEAGWTACISAESQQVLFDVLLRPGDGDSVTDDELRCIADVVTTEFNGFGAAVTRMASPTDVPVFAAALVKAYTSCGINGGFDSFVVSILTESGFSPAHAQCVVDQFADDAAGQRVLAQAIMQDPAVADQLDAAVEVCLPS